MSAPKPALTGFRDLDLPPALIASLDAVGYETPSPIQLQAIPHLLAGMDLLGNAPTGTGKTAAFALPLLARLDLSAKHVQVLTLTPTRELAIQVAEAFQRYAAQMPGFHVLPIYGGQEYGGQIRQLKRGVHVVVGTPGRVMDHMRKGTLKLDRLDALVLDEADEMLRMGFLEEVEWILEHAPPGRQIALFSATMPAEIERIARKHLRDPRSVTVAARTATAETVQQRYWLVSGVHKLDALTRILEVEPFEAVLIFVRTKIATAELAEKLEARGYSAAALNGDMAQQQREQTIERLRKGSLDILVATDVAARGLDVDRISHVVNFDIPYDVEAYIHRIGRTGRAGRTGQAILFVAPRERRMLNAIEKATRQKIDQLELPSTEVVNNKRIATFKQKISDTLAAGELAFMQSLVEQYQREHDVPAIEIAAALAKLSIGDQPLLLQPDAQEERRASKTQGAAGREGHARRRASRDEKAPREKRDEDKETFRIEVGRNHGVQPNNIVGAIANEAGLDSRHIGYIEILADHSFVDLPLGMPREIFRDLKKVWVCGQQLAISRADRGQPKERRDRAQDNAAGKPRKQGHSKRGGAPQTKPGDKARGKGKPAQRKRNAESPQKD